MITAQRLPSITFPGERVYWGVGVVGISWVAALIAAGLDTSGPTCLNAGPGRSDAGPH